MNNIKSKLVSNNDRKHECWWCCKTPKLVYKYDVLKPKITEPFFCNDRCFNSFLVHDKLENKDFPELYYYL